MLNRSAALDLWLKHSGLPKITKFVPLLGDASFRKYYRMTLQTGQTYMVMDAPPPQENCEIFVNIQALLQQHGLSVPEIIAKDLKQGFLVLEDFGDTLLLDVLTPSNVNDYYHLAIDMIIELQKIEIPVGFPKFDCQHMRQEMQLFYDWFLIKHLQLSLEKTEEALIHQSFQQIAQQISLHPQVMIHRDFHSRNLMIKGQQSLGMIDFQDAMQGPRTYDLVSLLRDCYIAWPLEQQQQSLNYFLRQQHLEHQFELVWAEFNLCGLQRHLKVLGIFCRIHYRDQKSRYLADLPLVLEYTMQALKEIPWLRDFQTLMQRKIVPAFHAMVTTC